MKIYTPEQIEFMRENCAGRSTKELTAMFNEQFGTSKTVEQIKNARNSYKCPRGPVYTDEQIEFIRKTFPGTPLKEMTEQFNKRFGTSHPQHCIAGAAYGRGIKNGIDTSAKITEAGKPYRFYPGMTVWNKGKKWENQPEACKATQFKKGQPRNCEPVGTERVRPGSGGYVYIKVSETPHKWREKHLVVWEAAHGPVPKGHCIVFADGNRLHTELDNLIMVTRSELARLNQNGLIYPNAKLTESALNAIKLKMKVWEKERQRK